jgi:trigger factor
VAISKEITRLERSSVKLTIAVSKDSVRSQYDEILAGYVKTLQVPGFRRGKVPKEVLERKIGSALKDETLGRVIENTMGEIFEDESFPREDKPLPYSSPQIQDEPSLNLDEDLQFSVVYDVLPRFTMGPWKGLEVEIPEVQVTGEDVGRELEALRERNAIVLDRDDGARAAGGDVVTVSYSELSDTGEPVPGTEREDFVFTLGSGYNLFKFDDEILGMTKGETRDIEKTYEADFPEADLAGKTKKIRVTLAALKEKKLPDLDDDFAQDVDEQYKTLEDLKTSVKNRLTKKLDRRLRDITTSAIIEKIMESTPLEVPESMIRIELDSRWRNLARRFNTSTEELIKIMRASGKEYDDIIAEWRPDAVKALHSRIIVEALIKENAFEISDGDLEKEFETLAQDSGSSAEEIKKYYEKDELREYLKEDIKEQKLFNLLLSENKAKTGKRKNYLDLIPNNG